MLLTVDELSEVLEDVRLDGRKRNIVCDCPYCGKKSKFGVSIIKEGNPFRCFSCNETGRNIKLMSFFGRLDLITEFVENENVLENVILSTEEDEIDVGLEEEVLPPRSKRVVFDNYLDSRNWYDESYYYIPVYKSKDFKYLDYIIIPITMYNKTVGYISRHKWSKKKIDNFNKKAKINNTYQILRYRNSEGNEFGKMLGGFDQIVSGETHTAILVEGYMDVENISKQLNLYENDEVKCVCTFGKKISVEQIYHLQNVGIKNVIVLYDLDAVEDVKKINLSKYFNVLVGSIDDASDLKDGDDAGDINYEQIQEIWENLKPPNDFFYNKVLVLSL